MKLRMLYMRCPSCEREEECLVSLKRDGTLDEAVVCIDCGHNMEIINDVSRQLNRDGNKYRHISWSQWNVT